MDIKVGDYDVLESGSVLCMKDYPVTFVFGGLSYKVFMHRDKDDDKGKTIEFRMSKSDINKAEIHFYLNDSILISSESPYMIGNYNNKSLSFAFSIESLSFVTNKESTIVLNYMWLQKDAVAIFESASEGEMNIREGKHGE